VRLQNGILGKDLGGFQNCLSLEVRGAPDGAWDRAQAFERPRSTAATYARLRGVGTYSDDSCYKPDRPAAIGRRPRTSVIVSRNPRPLLRLTTGRKQIERVLYQIVVQAEIVNRQSVGHRPNRHPRWADGSKAADAIGIGSGVVGIAEEQRLPRPAM